MHSREEEFFLRDRSSCHRPNYVLIWLRQRQLHIQPIIARILRIFRPIPLVSFRSTAFTETRSAQLDRVSIDRGLNRITMQVSNATFFLLQDLRLIYSTIRNHSEADPLLGARGSRHRSENRGQMHLLPLLVLSCEHIFLFFCSILPLFICWIRK